jgi:hypothetical protein
MSEDPEVFINVGHQLQHLAMDYNAITKLLIPTKGLFVLLSIHVDWVGLDEFQSQTSQNLS